MGIVRKSNLNIVRHLDIDTSEINNVIVMRLRY